MTKNGYGVKVGRIVAGKCRELFRPELTVGYGHDLYPDREVELIEWYIKKIFEVATDDERKRIIASDSPEVEVLDFLLKHPDILYVLPLQDFCKAPYCMNLIENNPELKQLWLLIQLGR